MDVSDVPCCCNSECAPLDPCCESFSPGRVSIHPLLCACGCHGARPSILGADCSSESVERRPSTAVTGPVTPVTVLQQLCTRPIAKTLMSPSPHLMNLLMVRTVQITELVDAVAKQEVAVYVNHNEVEEMRTAFWRF